MVIYFTYGGVPDANVTTVVQLVHKTNMLLSIQMLIGLMISAHIVGRKLNNGRRADQDNAYMVFRKIVGNSNENKGFL